MTNNPKKVTGIRGYGLEIVEHVPLIASHVTEREKYIDTKRDKLGHMIPKD
jgi:3,4-dihydroxy 2-butanone 4-phosphate synthase/GTP cyclohydrolase II